MGARDGFFETPGYNRYIMDNTENQTPEETAPQPDPAPRAPLLSAGTLIREAREKAGIAPAKLCADLRISPATLEALEAGDYGKLAGAPYVRAMLVSLSRHLRLDSRDVLKVYAAEVGGQPDPTVQVSPYKDDSGTHAKAHKQIFILLLAVLLFILLLIMGKVNTSSPETEPEAPPAATDTLLNLDPIPEDDSLPEDSLGVADTLSVAVPPRGASVEEDEVRETRVRVTALVDSVWLRVLPAGSREVSQYLRLNRSLEFTHDDAITFITRLGRTVRVIVNDSAIIPVNRRFKVDGIQVTY
jgi:cytoskeletal protein RodZ